MKQNSILFVDDEEDRYLNLLSKQGAFARRLGLEEIEIHWIHDFETFKATDLWYYQLIMLDHDMGLALPEGIDYSRYAIKYFNDPDLKAFLPAGLKPIIWIHSTNVVRAEQMEQELKKELFSVFVESFPRLISGL